MITENRAYMDGFAQGVIYANRPWDNIPMQNYDNSTTQSEKDFCLFHCPHMDNCSACDKCDGRGNLTGKAGRPKIQIDITELLILRETLTMAEICARLGVSRSTAYYALSKI